MILLAVLAAVLLIPPSSSLGGRLGALEKVRKTCGELGESRAAQNVCRRLLAPSSPLMTRNSTPNHQPLARKGSNTTDATDLAVFLSVFCADVCEYDYDESDGGSITCLLLHPLKTDIVPSSGTPCEKPFQRFAHEYVTEATFVSFIPAATYFKLEDVFGTNCTTMQTLFLGGNIFVDFAALRTSTPQVTSVLLVASQIGQLQDDAFQNLTALSYVSFSFNRLTSIPAALFAHDNKLSQVDFSNNQITSIPYTAYENLPALRAIDLSSNSITSILPNAFDRLTHLETLGLDLNAITSLPEGIFDSLKSLNTIRLARNALTQLPDDIFAENVALENIDLFGNLLTVTPPSIYPRDGLPPLSFLLSLDLSDNRITSFGNGSSPAVPPFQSLSKLDLSRNLLTELPSDLFSNNAGITKLSLSSNMFTAVKHSWLNPLSFLKTLDLRGNLLTSVDRSLFSGFTQLTSLDLSSNQIASLPGDVFRDLTALDDLSIAFNRILHLNATLFANLTALSNLDLSGNKLDVMEPAIFKSNKQLYSLNLSRNKITALSPGFLAEQTGLGILQLSHNRLSEFPLGVFRAKTEETLTSLNLSSNVLESLASDFTMYGAALEVLDLSNNRFSNSTALFALLNRSPRLRVLRLENNLLTELTNTSISALSSLFELDLSGNKMDLSADSLLSQAPIKLTLSNMSLTNLPSIQHMQNMLFLDISLNNLTMTYFALSSLITLNASYNSWLVFPYSVSLNPSLSIISVSGVHASGVANICKWSNFVTSPHHLSQVEARGLLFASEDEKRALLPGLMASCLSNADIVNLEDNAISDLELVRSTLESVNFFVPLGIQDDLVNPFVSLLQLGTENAVQCELVHKVVTRFFVYGDLPLPAYGFSCGCGGGFELDSAQRDCVPRPVFWSAERVALLSSGVSVATLVVTFAAIALVRSFAGLKKSLFHQTVVVRDREEKLVEARALLDDAEAEVEVLRRAWEIMPSEIRFDSSQRPWEGTYGEVRKGIFASAVVAIKSLKEAKAFDEDAKEQFQKEVEFLQRSSRHPNLVRFFGAGKWTNGVPFLVEEFVGGGSLQSALRHDRKHQDGAPKLGISWSRKISFALDVARGMEYIHGLGHMHRDLKSENVLVSETMVAKIADFGTVRDLINRRRRKLDSTSPRSLNDDPGNQQQLLHNESHVFSTFVGTPIYMSLEVLRGRGYTYEKPTDVWSFGVLLWEIFTQQEPDIIKVCGVKGPVRFPAAKLLQLLEEGKRLPPDPAWPTWLPQLLQSCFEADQAARPTFPDIVALLEGRRREEGGQEGADK